VNAKDVRNERVQESEKKRERELRKKERGKRLRKQIKRGMIEEKK